MALSSVVVFEHINFAGASLEVTDDLSAMPPGWDNRVSSIRTNTPVALFRNVSYGGEVPIVNQDTPDFRNVRGRDFNDLTSSIRFRQIYILLNVIQGDFDNTLARTYEIVNDDIAVANGLFGPYGFNIELADIRVGGTDLYEPKTTEDMGRLRAPFRLPNRLNVTYFTGDLFHTVSWRFRVRSAKLALAPGKTGSLHAELFTATNFSGTVQTCTSDTPILNTAMEDSVVSIRMADNTHITVFSERNFLGDRRTFRLDAPDLDRYHTVTDWWRDAGGRAGGDFRNWRFADAILRPKNPQALWLAREVARVFELPDSNDAANLLYRQLPANPVFTFQQAEAAMQHLHANAALRPFFEVRR